MNISLIGTEGARRRTEEKKSAKIETYYRTLEIALTPGTQLIFPSLKEHFSQPRLGLKATLSSRGEVQSFSYTKNSALNSFMNAPNKSLTKACTTFCTGRVEWKLSST